MKPLFLIAETMLRLVSAPVVAKDLWTARGVRRFVRRLPGSAPGSLTELSHLLGLFDHGVKARWTPREMEPARSTRGPGGALFGVWPGPRSGDLTVEWANPELLGSATRLAQAAEKLIGWWTPLGVVSRQLAFSWPEGALAVSPPQPSTNEEEPLMSDDVRRAMHVFARRILNVPRRRTEPAQTHIALLADRAVTIKAGRLSVGTQGIGKFMLNAEEAAPKWKLAEASSTTDEATALLTALGTTNRLDVLAHPSCWGAKWRLNGGRVVPSSESDFTHSFLLESVGKGTSLEVQVRLDPESATVGEKLWLYPNPTRFVDARFDDRQHKCVPATESPGGDPPGTFVQFASQANGLSGLVQPLAVTPRRDAESSAEWLGRAAAVFRSRLVGRADIREYVRSQLGPAAARVSVEVNEESWLTESPAPRVVEGVAVEVRGLGAGRETRQGIAARLRDALNRLLPPGLTARVEVMS